MRSWDHLSYRITQCYLPPDRWLSRLYPGILPVLIHRPRKDERLSSNIYRLLCICCCRCCAWPAADWHHIADRLEERILHADHSRHFRSGHQLLHLRDVRPERGCRCVIGRYRRVPMEGQREAAMLSTHSVSLVRFITRRCCPCSRHHYAARRLLPSSGPVTTGTVSKSHRRT